MVLAGDGVLAADVAVAVAVAVARRETEFHEQAGKEGTQPRETAADYAGADLDVGPDHGFFEVVFREKSVGIDQS